MKPKTNLFILLLIGLFYFPTQSVYSQSVKIQVFPEIEKQVIQSIGGNYCQANYSNHAWDKVGEATLREFRPSHVRVALAMKLRGIAYEQYKGENFVKQRMVVEVLESLKRMKTEFGVKNFTISVWDVPDEWIVDPTLQSQRVIKPEMYDEVIQALTNFFLKAKNEYGVEVDNFSFNESDGGWQIIFSPKQTMKFIRKAGESFRKAGLKTKFLLADTAQTLGTVEFSTQILADTTIWKFIGPLSFHSWWSEKIPDSEFERIAGLGKALKKEVWCAELGFDAMAWRTKGMNQTWDYALRFAKIWMRMMKHAEVEVSLYWTWQNNYEIMSEENLRKYYSYFITKHQVDFMNNGTQVVHSISSDKDILTFSGINTEGRKVIQIINLKKDNTVAELSGFTSNSVDLITTTEQAIWEESKKVAKTKKGITRLLLKPESVNTFIFN